MKLKRLWPYTTFVFGIISSLCGGALILAYVMKAIVARAGDPDQSLLFWHLPILFLGLIGLGAGLSLFVLASSLLRRIKQP